MFNYAKNDNLPLNIIIHVYDIYKLGDASILKQTEITEKY